MATLRISPRLLLDAQITCILVGPDKQKFSVHKALLCDRTEYFRSAYNTGLKEAQEHLFTVEDIESAIFAVFVTWLYTSDIFLSPSWASPLQLEREAGSSTRSIEGPHIDDSEPRCSEDDDADDEDYENDEVWPEYSDDDEPPELEDGSLERQKIWCLIRFNGEAIDLDTHGLEVLLKLTEDQPHHGEYRSKWEQILVDKQNAINQNADEGPEGHQPKSLFTTLIELYILADRFGAQALRIKIITHLHDQRRRQKKIRAVASLPTFHDVARAFENLLPSSPLRFWLIDVFAYDWDPTADTATQVADRELLPKDFLIPVLTLNSSRLQHPGTMETPPFDLDLCYYHQHETWEELKACREERGKGTEEGLIHPGDFDAS